MTEEQLNENLIKSELQCICQDCIYLDNVDDISMLLFNAINQQLKELRWLDE